MRIFSWCTMLIIVFQNYNCLINKSGSVILNEYFRHPDSLNTKNEGQKFCWPLFQLQIRFLSLIMCWSNYVFPAYIYSYSWKFWTYPSFIIYLFNSTSEEHFNNINSYVCHISVNKYWDDILWCSPDLNCCSHTLNSRKL